ncbi:MAG: hypothetical protein JXA14_26245 [Anaerolineae bacterium]|nr:hypothetical protein [Anaerolineae bacterium]
MPQEQKEQEREAKVSITWSVEYIDPTGFKCRLGIQGRDSKDVLARGSTVIDYITSHGAQPAPDVAATVTAAATLAPPRPLAEGQARILITKLKRTGETTADLFGRGHKYTDLKLFDLADLATVGIDYQKLEIGKDTACRFFAVWQESEKTNKAGNPYKDVLWLEAAG